MTTVGKLLVFANLVFGLGAMTWATAVYTQRPGWFNPPPEAGADKAGDAVSFPALAAQMDTLGKAAASAGAEWNAQYARLTKAEDTRLARQRRMFGATAAGGARTKGLLDFARLGGYPDPKAKGGAFFNLKDDPAGRLLSLDPDFGDKGSVVVGPDSQPLGGADTLLDRFNVDSAAVIDLATLGTKLRYQQRELGAVVAAEELRVLKQREILENLRVQAAYLAGFEVNAAGQLDWATARKSQLQRRLAGFRKQD